MTRVLSAILLILAFHQIGSAQGYEIKVQVNPLKDSTIYLANYFGAKLYYADTAQINKKDWLFSQARKR